MDVKVISRSFSYNRVKRPGPDPRMTPEEVKQPVSELAIDGIAQVPAGQPLLYIDSRGRLGVAVNRRSFAATYKVKPRNLFSYRQQGSDQKNRRWGNYEHSGGFGKETHNSV